MEKAAVKVSSRIAVGILVLIAVAFSVASIAHAKWYTIDHPTVLVRDYGVHRVCETVGLASAMACSGLRFDDITVVCTRDSSEMLQKARALAGTATASPFVCVISLVFFLLGHQEKRTWARWAGCLCCSAAAMMQAFSIAWSAYMYHNWYFCSTNYCEYQKQVGNTLACSSRAGVSWYLMIASLGFSCCILVVQAVKLVAVLRRRAKLQASLRSKQEPAARTAANMWQARVEAAPDATVHVHRAASPTPKEPAQLAPVAASPATGMPPPPLRWPDFSCRQLSAHNTLPDGVWTLDSACGLYWSNDEQLYVHLESGLFYDPHSQMWFDSETGDWFEA